MGGRKTRLTPELIEAIAKRIKVGTYPYIAAAACGIPKSTYFRWMQRAEEKGAPKIYPDLRDKISEAAGAARSNAELRVFRDNPFQWLRYGPGRDKPGQEGWSEPQTVKVEADVNSRQQVSIEEMIPDEVVKGALQVLCELGFIQPGPGQENLLGFSGVADDAADVIDVEAEPSGNGNGKRES
jgi:hypothetical protein